MITEGNKVALAFLKAMGIPSTNVSSFRLNTELHQPFSVEIKVIIDKDVFDKANEILQGKV